MNRVKLWLFTLLAVGAGLVWLNAASDWMAVRSIESIDTRLQAAKALADARSLLFGREVSAVAGAAARDPALIRVLTPPPSTTASPEVPRVRRPVRPLPLTPPGSRVRPVAPPPPPPVAVAPQQPPADPLPTAENVARTAVEAAGLDPGRGMVAGLVRFSRLTLRSKGQDVRVEGDAAVSSLLETARDGRAREALVRVEGATYRVSVVPIPVVSGVALAIGVPPDIDWIHSIRDATGVEVILPPNGKPVIGENKLILDTVKKPLPGAVSVGKFGTAKLPNLSWAPQIPLLFTEAPAWRATGVVLPGIAGTVVLCRSTRSELEPLGAYQQITLLGLFGLLILGLVIGFLIKSEPPLAIPKELFQAADRIAHGEFGVRAPALAGQLGTVADALNRAAEMASGGRSEERTLEAPEPLSAALYQEEPAHQEAPQQEVPQEALQEALQEAPQEVPQEALLQEVPPQEAPILPPTDPFYAAAQSPSMGGSGEATARDFFAAGRATALFSSPTAEAPEFPAAEPFPAASSPLTAEPLPSAEPLPVEPAPVEQPAPVAEPAPPAGGGDEEHWRQVFEEFLLIRRQCGEPADGLTYEKFRQKLQKNRDSLVQKYGCKVVRFQAYVKDGKAALKATPVR